MLNNPRVLWPLILGILMIVTGIALFTWFNLAVLTPAEVQRLEAGGSGESSFFESFALFGSPLIVLAGAAFLGSAWAASRKPDLGKLVYRQI